MMNFAVLMVFASLMGIFILKGTDGKLYACSAITSPDICHKGDYYSAIEFPPAEPTMVETIMWIKDISEINVEKQSITLFMQVLIRWNDERISFNQTDGNSTK